VTSFASVSAWTKLPVVLHESETHGIVTLRLAHGKASALDMDLVDGVWAALDRLGRSGARALVLTGTGGIFSAGVDLFKLTAGGPTYVERFLPALDRMFEALFTFPAPVVAAVNGHAIAGGCILACSCDRRLMTTAAARIGLPELKVGVPFPPLVVEIIRSAVPPPYFTELLYVGRTYDPAEALARGVVDELAPHDELEDRARRAASELAAVPAASFRLTKRAIRLPYLERARQTMAAERGALLAAWSAADTHTAIKAYLEKTLGTRK
jgi:enoyl-CoA hydratase